MTTNELRQAADTLRESATLATAQPEDGRNARYIATMHPGVGLALAMWLEAQAEHVASHDCEAHCAYPDGGPRCRAALTLARLINGGAS